MLPKAHSVLHGPSQTQEGAPGKPSQTELYSGPTLPRVRLVKGVIMSSSMPLKVCEKDKLPESQMVWAWAGAMMIRSSKASSRFAGARPGRLVGLDRRGLIRWVLVGFSELSGARWMIHPGWRLIGSNDIASCIRHGRSRRRRSQRVPSIRGLAGFGDGWTREPDGGPG